MLLKEQLEKYKFSPAESIVVNYLLDFPEKLEELSIQQLASETYTQPSTLVRIAKKLNYRGWKDFKKAYLDEWRYLSKNFSKVDANFPFNKKDSVTSITQKLASLEKSTLNDIASLLSHDMLMNAKQLLLQADFIYIFAQNANLLIAEDFALKMKRIGKPTYISSIKGEETYEAYNISENSCTIFISYSGENYNLLKVNQVLKKRNIPTIAITSIGDNQLSKQCDLYLPITTREKLYSKIGNFTSNTSIIFLLDVLYSAVFVDHYEENLNHLKWTGELIDKRETSTDIIKEKRG